MAANTLLTSDPFLALPMQYDRSGNRTRDELIAGELVIKPIPCLRHSIVFAPDVCVTTRSRLAETTEFFPGSPELAVEVASDGDTATHLKRKTDMYSEGGSQSVWIVYPEAHSVVVYTGVDYNDDSMHEVKTGQSISGPLLPGFSSPVAAFFELT